MVHGFYNNKDFIFIASLVEKINKKYHNSIRNWKFKISKKYFVFLIGNLIICQFFPNNILRKSLSLFNI